MLKRILHGIARMCTLPRALRQQIARNPIAAEVKPVLAAEVRADLEQAVDLHVNDPVQAAVAKAAALHAIEMTGVFK